VVHFVKPPHDVDRKALFLAGRQQQRVAVRAQLVSPRVEDRRESRKRIGLNGILESRAFLGSKQFVRKLVKEKTTPPECAQLLLTVCQRKLHALSSLERAVG